MADKTLQTANTQSRRCYNRWRRRGVGDGEPATIHGGGSVQYQPATGQQKSQGDRPYWEKSYSGGPIDVAPLPPGLPEKDTSRSWSRTAARYRLRSWMA